MHSENLDPTEPEKVGRDTVWDAITRDGRVAVWTEGPDRYLYRPNHLLVDARYDKDLADILTGEGARRSKGHCRESRLLERLGIRRWTMVGSTRDARESLAPIREKAADRAPRTAVTLSHVLGGAPVMKFGPGDLPTDGGAGPVQVEPSKRPGTGKGVRVAILDTGFVKASTSKHPLLSHGYTDDGDDVDDLYDETTRTIRSVFGGHGTFIAGIIRQQAPDTELDPEVTLDDVGLVDDVELALDLLRARPAHIVNLSLAGPSENQEPPKALALALKHLGERSDAVVVAAAGNDFLDAEGAGVPHQKMWPAAFAEMKGYEHVVGVGAVDRERAPAIWSNRGPWLRACAYGVQERSTYVEGELALPAGPVRFGPAATATWSGTSFAAPRVAGVIAATMTSDRGLSARDALAEVLANASPGPTDFGTFID